MNWFVSSSLCRGASTCESVLMRAMASAGKDHFVCSGTVGASNMQRCFRQVALTALQPLSSQIKSRSVSTSPCFTAVLLLSLLCVFRFYLCQSHFPACLSPLLSIRRPAPVCFVIVLCLFLRPEIFVATFSVIFESIFFNLNFNYSINSSETLKSCLVSSRYADGCLTSMLAPLGCTFIFFNICQIFIELQKQNQCKLE